jgi:hypothetical protein
VGLSLGRSGTNLILAWPDTGITWKLAASPNPATTNWVVLTPNLTLTNGQYHAVLPMTNSSTLYRLQK